MRRNLQWLPLHSRAQHHYRSVQGGISLSVQTAEAASGVVVHPRGYLYNGGYIVGATDLPSLTVYTEAL